MDDDQSLQRFAAAAAVLALPVAFAGTLLTLMSADFDPVALDDPKGMLAIAPANLGLMNWGMLFYLLGYFLLWLPMVVALWRWLSVRSPAWAAFSTVCGLLYVAMGVIASGIAIGVHPEMIAAYAASSGAERDMVVTAFSTSWYAQVYGLTGIAQHIPAAAWWLGVGLLVRRERRWLGTATLALGGAALLDIVATVLPLGPVGAALFFLTYVVGGPIWALSLGISVWRRPVLVRATSEATPPGPPRAAQEAAPLG